jgi:hypothetical protein
MASKNSLIEKLQQQLNEQKRLFEFLFQLKILF